MGPIDLDSMMGGATWLEIFTLFDITGSRTQSGVHVKAEEVAKRVGAQKKKRRC